MKCLVILLLIFITYVPIVAQPLQLSKGATQAALIFDSKTGHVVYEYNADLWVTPASLTKLYTTAASMFQISPSAKFETKVYLDNISNVLYIKGLGDPTYNSKFFSWHSVEAFADKVATSLIQRDIKHLSNIVFDDSYIDGAPLSSKRVWEDMGNYYGASPSSFNIFDNTINLFLQSPDKSGKLCKVVDTEPSVEKLPNSYVTSYAKSADSVYVYGTSIEDWYVSGAMPMAKSRFKVRAAMFSPESFFMKYFVEQVKKRGIDVGAVKNSNIPINIVKQKPFLIDYSPSIEAIATVTNQESNNLFADALLLNLSAKEGKTSWDCGVRKLNEFVAAKTGVNSRLYDGSGLSPFGKTTARQIVSMLRAVRQSNVSDNYMRTLSIAGKNGTLRSFGKGTSVENNVRGKSGSMTGVVAFAGYVDAKSELIFCIIINNHIESNTNVKQMAAKWLATYIK